ncbi:MAG TPA: DUF4173 domain-containing protein [Flavobacterium sp.]|nr:DUF4173 domain-containing protein [Flavobacterium sp.]
MKKYQLIFASTFVFVVLFYDQSVGVNLGLFGLFLLGLLGYQYAAQLRNDKLALVMAATSLLSCFAFTWYGDFSSFLAMFSSFVLLQFRLEQPSLQIILALPVTIVNAMASVFRVFLFKDYLPQQNLENDLLKKVLAYLVIPVVLVSLFVIVYAFGSDLISNLFLGYEWDINIKMLVFLSIFGFYFSFSYWNFWTPQVVLDFDKRLQDDFVSNNNGDENTSLLGIDFERKSGEISLFLLNILILIFIGSYSYEQFFQQSNDANLSVETHERINSVIVSMIMAIAVVLSFFRGAFSFEAKGQRLRTLAQVWIVLNVFLMMTAFLKNAEYVSEFGLTYKRLGVFAFLILVLFGLLYSFLKLKKGKTNSYLCKRMFWYFYALILLCSYINWGNLVTQYNLAQGKDIEKDFLEELNFNDEIFFDLYSEELNNVKVENSKIDELLEKQSAGVLSKSLYYETIDLKK